MKLRFPLSALALATSVFALLPADAQTLPDLPILVSTKLSLRDALSVAASDNLTLKQMQADANSASAAARSAKAQTKPSLSTTTYGTLGDSANILTTSPGVAPQNTFAVAPRPFADQNLMLMVPLLTGGRLGNMVIAARKQEEAAELSIEASRLSVTESVISAYADAALQSALIDVAQARLNTEDEQVRVTQEKVTTGRSAPVDLLREQAEQADARQTLLASQNNAALALVSLKVVLGISQSSNIALSDTLSGLSGLGAAVPATLQDALKLADTNRPEMAAALRQVEAAQAGVGAARGEYAPQLYGVAMGDATTGAGAGRIGYTVGLTASLPLYDGGQRQADVDGARARLDRATLNAQQTRQAVDQQVAAAWLSLQAATALGQAAIAGLTAAQEAYTLAALRYNAGKSVIAERLDALSAQVRAQGALAHAQADIITAQANLSAAIGGSHERK